MPSIKDYQNLILEALDGIKNLGHHSDLVPVEENLCSYLYTPDIRLNEYLSILKREVQKRRDRDPDAYNNSEIGNLLEQIAYLCFAGLVGYSSIKSFQSPGPQYDLIISGDDRDWLMLCKFLFLQTGRDFLVEVKAINDKVNDQQFARLCSLLQFNLFATSGLGIFFTINGATGFPESISIRQRSLSDARLRQAIFLAACKKPIVVFDIQDISLLDKPGSLVKILINKIRDVEQLCGITSGPKIDSPKECDLPPHLADLHGR